MSDDDLARHMVERQLVPQLRAAELGAETRFVSNVPTEGGVEIECANCGRKAWADPATAEEMSKRVILCPDCIPSSPPGSMER